MKLLISLFLISSASFACRTDALIITNSSSFSGSFKLSEKRVDYDLIDEMYTDVNIPFSYDNRRGCFKQKSGLEIVAKKKRGRFSGELEVFIPQVSFKNVDGKVRSYFDISGSESDTLQFDMVSFVCIGQTAIAAESYSGTIQDIVDMNNVQFSRGSSLFFSTVNNASSPLSNYNNKRQLYGYGNLIPKRMFESISTKVESLDHRIDDKLSTLPSIVLHNRMNFGSISKERTFSTVNTTLYGCTDEFDDLMKDYRLQSLPRKLNNTKIKYKKRRNSVRIYLK